MSGPPPASVSSISPTSGLSPDPNRTALPPNLPISHSQSLFISHKHLAMASHRTSWYRLHFPGAECFLPQGCPSLEHCSLTMLNKDIRVIKAAGGRPRCLVLKPSIPLTGDSPAIQPYLPPLTFLSLRALALRTQGDMEDTHWLWLWTGLSMEAVFSLTSSLLKLSRTPSAKPSLSE